MWRQKVWVSCLRLLSLMVIWLTLDLDSYRGHPMIKPLPNPDFFRELKNGLKRARRSITIVNFLAELEVQRSHGPNPMRELADLLIEKRRGGMEVVVFLEGSKN